MSYQTQVPNYDTTTGAPLPAGWVRWVDPETDDFYYHNESTGETTWDDPTRWKVGLLFDRLRGEPPKEAPLYRPRTIECAFAEYSAADENESDGDAPVTLRVYDVSFRGAGALNSLLNGSSGAFHTAIEVHGLEWSFGATTDDDDDTSGIFACDPASAQPHRYREAIPLGRTKKSPVDVFNILLRLAPFWLGKSYDVLRKNCNSFCILFSGELGADAPPPWTHRLGDGAAALDDRVSRLLETTGLGGGDEPRADGPAAVVWDHPQRVSESPMTPSVVDKSMSTQVVRAPLRFVGRSGTFVGRVAARARGLFFRAGRAVADHRRRRRAGGRVDPAQILWVAARDKAYPGPLRLDACAAAARSSARATCRESASTAATASGS
jgi:hypothetical protein